MKSKYKNLIHFFCVFFSIFLGIRAINLFLYFNDRPVGKHVVSKRYFPIQDKSIRVVHNEDYKTLGLEALEDSFKKEFTKVIEINDIGNIKEISENYIKNFKFDKKKLDLFLNKNGIILEKASDNAYKKICELMSDLN